jgi:hypothetical protein
VFTWINGPIRRWQGGRFYLFDKKVAQSATFLSKRKNKYHAAAGEDCRCGRTCLMCTPTA